ncbi:hypothetical protein [Chlamydia vaughanii]|uniref:hypothetical protein n=1 Tax=Chlamydia vaughanii TaxID=3112552 RepID=UPI0032B12FBF
MKDKKNNNDILSVDLRKGDARAAAVNTAMFSLTDSTITSTRPVNMSSQNITGLADPTKGTDAVSLTYLESNYVKKNDPQSGYLPTTGGIMTGNIDMSTHKIINLGISTATPPTGSTVTPPAGSNPGTPDPTTAVNVQYVQDMANQASNNPGLNEALNKITGVTNRVDNIEDALGIVKSDSSNPGTTPPAPKNPQFVATAGATMSGDLKMSNHTITGLGTPEGTDTSSAVNVEYVQRNITTPPIGFLSSNITNSTTVTDYFSWEDQTPVPPAPPPPAPPQPSPTPSVPGPAPTIRLPESASPTTTPTNPSQPTGPTSPIPPTTTTPGTTPPPTNPPSVPTPAPVITTPITKKYLEIDSSDKKIMNILGVGILTLCFSITWTGDTKEHISVILNQTPTSGGSSGGTAAADTVVYDLSALTSGQQVCCQIPVTDLNSKLKLKFTQQTTPPSGSSSLTVTSWSWQATLLPALFTTTTPPQPVP